MNKPVVCIIASFSVVLLLVAAFAASPFICAVSAFASMIFASLTAICYCFLPNHRDLGIMMRYLTINGMLPTEVDLWYDEIENLFLKSLEVE